MKNYIEINKKAYDDIAYQYQARHAALKETQGYIKVVQYLDKQFPNKDNVSVLDIGCGNGMALAEFNQYEFFKCTGIDISQNMLDYAKNNSPTATLICADTMTYDFPKNEFDVIYASAFIHCFPKSDADLMLQKIHSWLKPDGIFFVCTTISTEPNEGLEEKKDYNGNIVRYRARYTDVELQTKLAKSGFTVFNIGSFNETSRGKLWHGYYCKKKLATFRAA